MRPLPPAHVRAILVCAIFLAPWVHGCDGPRTNVSFDNDYPPSTTSPLVVYHLFWQAVSFQTPVVPGGSSDPQPTVAASANPAYVVLAPGWDPASAVTPASFVVLQSKHGFEVHLDDSLHIPVDDTTFTGNCAAGSLLSQAEADFITRQVFAGDFAGLGYDAATCTTTGGP